MKIKEINFSEQYKNEILKGVEILYKAVVSTLGPSGKNVVIENDEGELHITKDGVTVAKSIRVENKLQDLAIRLVKKAAIGANDVAGDGTTTATVLAYEIIKKGLKQLSLGGNPIELKRGIDEAVKYVKSELNKVKKEVTTETEIKYVGMVSSNNDEKIGTLLSEAIKEVGRDGVIMVEDSKSNLDTLEIVKGMRFDRGSLSHYFYNNPESLDVELDNPYILVYDKVISSAQQVMKILQSLAQQTNKTLLIIAEDVTDQALAVLVMNKIRGNMNLAAVRAPAYGERRKQYLEDIAVLVGTEVISFDKGQNLEDISNLDLLGKANKVKITQNKTTIIDGNGSEDKVAERLISIKNQIDSSDNSYDKKQLQERYAKLADGIAIIKIGAETEMELNERKDRLEDALNATKAAVENGILPGGGLSLIRIQKMNYTKLPIYKELTKEQQFGFEILMNSLDAPFHNILVNAGINSDIIWDKLSKKSFNYGYDVRNNKFGDMYESGIIDPKKVVETALEKSASIAGLFLTTETIINNSDKNKEEVSQPEQQQYY
jgi:chaperonin GroEL